VSPQRNGRGVILRLVQGRMSLRGNSHPVITVADCSSCPAMGLMILVVVLCLGSKAVSCFGGTLAAHTLTVRWPERPGPTLWENRPLISPDELPIAWARLFGRVPWKVFATLTFEEKRHFPVNQPTASREAYEWCCSLGRLFRSPIAWLYATECGRGGLWHAHALITDLTVQKVERAAEAWRLRNGNVIIRPVSDGQRAVLYTSKDVPKGAEVQWSDTVKRYRDHLLPEVIVRLTSDGASI